MRWSPTLSPGLEAIEWDNLGSLPPPPRGDSLAPASRVAGITGVHHHAWLIFVLLEEAVFHHVGQAGLELLTSGDQPSLASQSAGITGVSPMLSSSPNPLPSLYLSRPLITCILLSISLNSILCFFSFHI